MAYEPIAIQKTMSVKVATVDQSRGFNKPQRLGVWEWRSGSVSDEGGAGLSAAVGVLGGGLRMSRQT